MNGRDLLLRCYPRVWREEYGEEFAAILAQKPISAGLILDVVLGGMRQRLRLDDPWKICAAALAVWTCFGIALQDWRVPQYYWFAAGFLGAPFTASFLSVWQGRASVLRSATRGIQVLLLGCLPDVAIHFVTGPHTSHLGGELRYHWGIYYATSLELTRWGYVWMMFQATALYGFFLGLLGAQTGAMADGFRQGFRAAR